jgi:hypothetical protein
MCNSDKHEFYIWLSGLIDGEGHFGLYHSRGSVRRPHSTTLFEFRLKLRDDDERIIRHIHRELGFGNVYRIKASSSVRNARPLMSFQIDSVHPAAALVDILDGHPLRTKKRADYEVWREAVIIARDQHTSLWSTFEPFASRIKAARVYSPPEVGLALGVNHIQPA